MFPTLGMEVFLCGPQCHSCTAPRVSVDRGKRQLALSRFDLEPSRPRTVWHTVPQYQHYHGRAMYEALPCRLFRRLHPLALYPPDQMTAEGPDPTLNGGIVNIRVITSYILLRRFSTWLYDADVLPFA